MSKFWRRAGDIGIDLGTANTLIAMRDRGLVLEEPSVVAVDRVRGAICAVGSDAKAMMGRTPAHLTVVRPLRDGVVADLNVTRQMLEHFVGRVYRGRGFMSPRVMVGVPSGITEVERRAVESAAETATGARQAHTIEEPMAAALGAGLPVDDSAGSMIVDIGGGTTEVAVISLGGIVAARSIRIGGDEVDEALRSHIRHTHNLAVGEVSIERLKLEAASAYAVVPDTKVLVRGRSLITGLPAAIELSSGELRSAIREPVSAIIEIVRSTLEGAPPELCADIMECGITLAGGGSLLRGLNVAIERALGTPVVVCDAPLAAVALGTLRALERRCK
ncbi:rod shape-determining protein MreB [Abditibacteriota bacterium]|nr:rod shape-determining protein MreB [Abditibacteriota bacterium]